MNSAERSDRELREAPLFRVQTEDQGVVRAWLRRINGDLGAARRPGSMIKAAPLTAMLQL
jgi:hypothetical protein